jgi:hypothetical protein
MEHELKLSFMHELVGATIPGKILQTMIKLHVDLSETTMTLVDPSVLGQREIQGSHLILHELKEAYAINSILRS